MGHPWIFPYHQSPMIYLISIDSYVLILHPLSSTPYLYDQGYTNTSIVMATYRPHSFNSYLLCLVHSLLYSYTIILS